MKIEKQLRSGLPQVGVKPYGQIHVHSTGNPSSTAQNEADYHMRRPVNSGFFSHVVGNGRVIQTARTNAGFYDVGGGWNSWGYAAIELIESHKTKEEFMKDYKLYVELIRLLCDEAGLPKTLDQGNTGVISHDYARKHQPNNGTDHVDPYPYLKKWGISKEQFAKDIKNGFGSSNSGSNSGSSSKPSTAKDARQFANGTKVKVRSKATNYQTGEKIASFVKGQTYKVKSRKSVNQSNSKYAYLLDGINSWVLVQDLDEVKSSSTQKTFKVGDKAKVRKSATNYQTGQKIASFVKGQTYKVKQVKNVNQSRSKKAYLLDGINSWVLEQDLE